MSSQNPENKGLQHDGKMSLKDRIEESQTYGENYRAEHAGADQREAVQPLSHRKPGKSDSTRTNANDGATDENI